MAGVAAAGRKRDRRRHPRRAGRAERQSDRLGAERGGACRDRPDYERVMLLLPRPRPPLVRLFRHGRARPGHPRLPLLEAPKTWMPGTRPGMTILLQRRRG